MGKVNTQSPSVLKKSDGAQKVGYGQTFVSDVLDNVYQANDKRLQVVRKKMLDGLPVKIVCVGDSITAGNSVSYPAELQTLLRDYYDNNNITVVNSGKSGFRSDQLIDEWSVNVENHNPDIVVIMCGMNDCIQAVDVNSAYDNYFRMYEIATKAGSAIIAADITPHCATAINGSGLVDVYRAAVFSVAGVFGVRVVNMSREMEALYAAAGGAVINDLLADGVHFTDRGYKEMAGVFFSLALAGGNLRVKCGEKITSNNLKVKVSAGNAVSRVSAMSVDFEPLRITPSVYAGCIKLYLYLDSVEQCDLVIAASREVYAGRVPRCGVINESMDGAAIDYFVLGQDSGTVQRVMGVPFVACALKPGLNVVKLFPLDTGTLEVSSFVIVPRMGGKDLDFIESSSFSVVPYSAINVNYGGVDKVVSCQCSVSGGEKRKLFRFENLYGSKSVAYRLRGKLTDGTAFTLGQAQVFQREWREAGKFVLTSSGENVRGEIVLVDLFGVVRSIAVNEIFGSLSDDVRLDFYQTGQIFSVFFNGALLVSVPFMFGTFDMHVIGGLSGVCSLNPVYKLTPEASVFTVYDGESWVDFTQGRFFCRTGGVDRYVVMV